MEPNINLKKYFLEALNNLKINIENCKIDTILKYYNYLNEKNKYLNLISKKQDDFTNIVVHLIDSLSPILWADLPLNGKALDIGSGGGLPGIPLSIVYDNWKMTLVESKTKKINFLIDTINSLFLNNLIVSNIYLKENINDEKLYYDIITARAVSKLANIALIVGPRLNKGGIFISFKGPQAENEILEAKQNLDKWNLTLENKICFELPFVQAKRNLLFFRKK